MLLGTRAPGHLQLSSTCVRWRTSNSSRPARKMSLLYCNDAVKKKLEKPTLRARNNQVYFYGELVPPYIDKLGRGALLRSTDSDNALYQAEAKCYRNQQALGSKASYRLTQLLICVGCSPSAMFADLKGWVVGGLLLWWWWSHKEKS